MREEAESMIGIGIVYVMALAAWLGLSIYGRGEYGHVVQVRSL